jgi:hypothetical protein
MFAVNRAASKLKVHSSRPVRANNKMPIRTMAAPASNQSGSPDRPLSPADFRVRPAALISLEALIYRRSMDKTHLLLIPLFLIQFLPSIRRLDGALFIFASISPSFLFANITFRMKDLYVHSTLAYKRTFFLSKIMFFTGWIFLFFGGTILNLLLAQEYIKVIMLLAGLFFTVSLAAGGSLVSMHLFSFCYLFLWYLGVMQHLPAADLYGIHGHFPVTLGYVTASLLILFFTYKKL